MKAKPLKVIELNIRALFETLRKVKIFYKVHENHYMEKWENDNKTSSNLNLIFIKTRVLKDKPCSRR